MTYLGLSPDGHVLVAVCDDGEIGLWSITDGKALASPVRDSLRIEADRYIPPFFGPNSTRLFLNRGRAHNALEVWDWSTGKLSITYEADLRELEAFAFSPNGAVLAAAWSGGVIVLLDTKESRLIGTLRAHGAAITCLAFSPSGRLLASGSQDRSAKLWDAKTQRELQTLGGNDDYVSDLAFTPDETSVLTLTRDGKIKVWDVRSVLGQGLLWRTTNMIARFELSTDDRAIATTDSVGGIHVWDLVTGRETRKVQTGDTPFAIDLSFSPADHILAWTGFTSLGILDYESGQTNTFPISRLFGHCNAAFSPTGRELAFVDGTNIMTLDMATRDRRPFAAFQKNVIGLAFSPNGSLLASAHDGGGLTLWDRRNGHKVSEEKLAHPPVAWDVEFSRDGRLLASGGSDATAKLWAVMPGGLKLRHTLRSTGVVFSPDGRRVAYGSNDGILKLWDTKTGLEVATLYGHRGKVAGVAFSRDGNTIYSAAQDGEVRIWRAPLLDRLEAPRTEKKFKR